ncbi:50S ribosomal protein L18 [Candidatus Sulfurimonas baltica]|uniref:Large ribosomal subunit protein uL18 n=1 Tax=Candidatus Sulfurimonas baltica TaxID=2740404 RepID=A0A7S7LUK2_9BACT|nr:50S ribosomal protein L18 [Candidatus Sulfurimonas baltica]QOY51759.1 50S ribosomal protein L18 [Candidatus Sulfurimonas baltica]
MKAKVLKSKIANRLKRKLRIRAKISGCASLPRVSVFRSNRYLSVQAIDDSTATTLAALNSKAISQKSNKEGAAALGEAFAATLKAAKISEIVFDRNGYQYHGVIAAFGDALRANEIKF